ncbi:hypothetical protein I4F81_004890 [Pyropia yezoensis]|uniref:Uncharacterized protein n=1 Tax=Pyropia yezoensis TaxID=2788 RepID=A0ACC3BXB2_PYRYE|nr:hypothetical protein I4F81_004890 [Neopyropia yezoensis]
MVAIPATGCQWGGVGATAGSELAARGSGSERRGGAECTPTGDIRAGTVIMRGDSAVPCASAHAVPSSAVRVAEKKSKKPSRWGGASHLSGSGHPPVKMTPCTGQRHLACYIPLHHIASGGPPATDTSGPSQGRPTTHPSVVCPTATAGPTRATTGGRRAAPAGARRQHARTRAGGPLSSPPSSPSRTAAGALRGRPGRRS